MVTKKEVIAALKKVIDPELGINIVDLGLIYNIKIEKRSVKIKMTLTNPACPLRAFLVKEAETAIKNLGVENVDIELTFEPPWSPEKLSKVGKKLLGFIN